MPIGFSFWGRKSRRINNQNSEIRIRVKNNLQTRNNALYHTHSILLIILIILGNHDHTNISTKRSVVSELQTLIHNVLAWCGTVVHLVRTFK